MALDVSKGTLAGLIVFAMLLVPLFTPSVSAFAGVDATKLVMGVIVGLIGLGLAVVASKNLRDADGWAELLVGLGLLVTGIVALPIVGGFVAGFASYAVLAVAIGVVILYGEMALGVAKSLLHM